MATKLPLLALSVLFIVPFYLSQVASPVLQHTITNTATAPKSQILFSFLYAFTVLTLALCATATITYSLCHGFFGLPVILIYALKSLSNPLFRLYATFFCTLVVILVSLVGVGMIVLTLIRVIESFALEIEFSSLYFRIFWLTGNVVLELLLMYSYVSWVLVPVIVGVESSWGLEPSCRSAYLVKGMRGVVVCSALFYGATLLSILFGIWARSWETTVLKDLILVVQTVMGSAVLMLCSLQSVYMNYKALRGELGGEIVEEFAQEYVSLPFYQEKVPHDVSIVQP